MPIFIQNMNEVRNQDDSPLPQNTPSTGSICDNNHVVECGHRVLKLIEKHKKEAQSKMATTEHGFRLMLEKIGTQESQDGLRSRFNHQNISPVGGNKSAQSASEKSRIVQLYNNAIIDNATNRNPRNTGEVPLTNLSGSNEPPVYRNRTAINSVSSEYFDTSANTTKDDDAREEAVHFRNNPLPLIRLHANEEDAMYEPDEASEIDEDCCNDVDDHNANNNKSVPTFVTQVQFQLPQVADATQDEVHDIEANPHPTTHHSRQNLKPQASNTSTVSKQKHGSKHGVHVSKSSTSQRQHLGAPPSQGGAPSDHDMSSRSGRVAITNANVSTTWINIYAFCEKYWSTFVITAIIIIIIGVFIMYKYPVDNEDYGDRPTYMGPVM